MKKVVMAFVFIAAATLSACSGSDGTDQTIGAASAAGQSSFAGSPGTGGSAGADPVSTGGSGSQAGFGGSAGSTSVETGGAGSAGAAGAGSAGAGGNPATGGAAGATATGGSTSTGGSSTGGTAGAPATGGSAGVGGEPGTGGTTSTGGQPPVMTPFSCSAPQKVTSFPQGYDLMGEGFAQTSEKLWQLTGYVSRPHASIPLYSADGGKSWTEVSLPASSGEGVYTLYTVWGTDSEVWIGGGTKTIDLASSTGFTGNSRGALWHCVGTSCQQLQLGLSASGNLVTSVTGLDAQHLFVLVNVNYALKGADDVEILSLNGTSVTSMTLPAHQKPTRLVKLWADPATGQVFATGSHLSTAPNSAVLWRLDANSWTDLASLPSDMSSAWELKGADGELLVVGYMGNGASLRGIHCNSMDDGSTWACERESAPSGYETVWVPRIGAGLIGGLVASSIGNDIPGGARFVTRSEGGSSDQVAVDSIMEDVSAIVPIPGTNNVMIAGQGTGSASAELFVLTCQ